MRGSESTVDIPPARQGCHGTYSAAWNVRMCRGRALPAAAAAADAAAAAVPRFHSSARTLARAIQLPPNSEQ